MSRLDALVAAYAFTPDDKQRLTRLLAEAYLQSRAQAYQKAVATTQHLVRLYKPWTPSEQDAKAATQWAKEQVEGIAGTYEERVRSIIEEQIATSTEQERAFADSLVGGAINAIALANGIRGGVKAFITWKAPQITNATWGKGANDGTRAFVEDVLAESEADEEDEDVGDLIDEDTASNLERIRVEVVPSESSSDFCKDYAGNSYSLAEVASIPDFPAHPNCQHELQMVTS